MSVDETPSIERVLEQRIDDLGGHVVEVSLEYFFSNILPPLPGGVDVPKVMESLREDSIVDGRWAAFEVNPSEDDRDELIVFDALRLVFDSVITAASQCLPGAKQTLEVKLSLTKAPKLEKDTGIRPDGFLILKNQTKRCADPLNTTKLILSQKKSGDGSPRYNVAATAGFKKWDESPERDRVSSRHLLLIIMLKIS